MLTKQANPFRNQLAVTHKQLQVIKMREYIYIYLSKLDGITNEEACAIASLDAERRLTDSGIFSENDMRYINGRLEEIEKLNGEIKSMEVFLN